MGKPACAPNLGEQGVPGPRTGRPGAGAQAGGVGGDGARVPAFLWVPGVVTGQGMGSAVSAGGVDEISVVAPNRPRDGHFP